MFIPYNVIYYIITFIIIYSAIIIIIIIYIFLANKIWLYCNNYYMIRRIFFRIVNCSSDLLPYRFTIVWFFLPEIFLHSPKIPEALKIIICLEISPTLTARDNRKSDEKCQDICKSVLTIWVIQILWGGPVLCMTLRIFSLIWRPKFVNSFISTPCAFKQAEFKIYEISKKIIWINFFLI